MTDTIEFFFDVSSPWTYLAFHNIQPMMAEHDFDIRWRPFLVGGVHNAVNPSVAEARANTDSPKFRQVGRSLYDWAALSGVTMNFPSEHHPLRSVHLMRFCCLLEADQAALFQFARAGFEAYFTDQTNLDDPETLVAFSDQQGLNGADLWQRSQDQACKDKLRANTDEAIARGAYGSPSIFVPFGDGERLYFGNDQLPLVAWAIEENRKRRG
ncbi:MAG: 2-hydroxychromene-2-carboxylate isomerase [Hyphomonadaceae bacterium]|nr:2-hydroxychromene-2-carboxylate isomerase [Hyphomonadaceae bacterium]